MPHAVFNLGTQGATADLAARSLVPGVEPGGSRAGRPTKPALLIKNAYLQLIDEVHDATPSDFDGFNVFLKLSQESDLTPGLILFIAGAGIGKGGAAQAFHSTILQPSNFPSVGTIWAPRFVGIRIEILGGLDSVDVDVHLDYERIEVPWMDWFIMWEFLDGIIDNEREY